MTAFWVALGGALVLTGVLIPMLRRVGISDVPNDRSMHVLPTPRGGGIAVLLAVLLATPAMGGADVEEVALVLAAALVLGTVGLVDDVRSLPPVLRLAAQGIVALAVSVTVQEAVGAAGFGTVPFLLVATLATVAYVNAFNFMDGVNVISGLNAAICGAWFAWLGHEYDLTALLVVGSALAGAALGFLPWNGSSRIFLGDVGSYGVGGLVAAASVLAWGAGVPAALVLAPTLVYFADTGWVILKRARAGQSLTQAHRGHVYQRLVQQGWPHWASAAWSAALAAVICVMAAYLYDGQPVTSLLLATLTVLTYLATPRLTSLAGAERTAS
ncbi:glycosyltransferase family 4 protein [Nocardioides sp. cx-173]|uniref:MraY family glycosyltransferase n=1 Tax=Nocardioides sp. cx-173 TaxID=2898796 RepID=UPI001E47CBA6|nr:glycosyltransferase family 4 protein [Nocardioides sp. cx-173]MCD4523760.1 glycosyltransferase family 4 protein [Nocardioides sp. cx-173]UGB41916.1 glycosyltransferase family 4 protein [Nocardioides sp. cx-173]